MRNRGGWFLARHGHTRHIIAIRTLGPFNLTRLEESKSLLVDSEPAVRCPLFSAPLAIILWHISLPFTIFAVYSSPNRRHNSSCPRRPHDPVPDLQPSIDSYSTSSSDDFRVETHCSLSRNFARKFARRDVDSLFELSFAISVERLQPPRSQWQQNRKNQSRGKQIPD